MEVIELREIVTGIVERCERYKPHEIVDVPYLLGIDRERSNELFDYLMEQSEHYRSFTELLSDMVLQAKDISELLFMMYLFGRIVEMMRV